MKRAVALVLALAAAACSRTPAPEAGELRVVPLAGKVSLLDGEDSSFLEEATTVDLGVGVATGSEGRARIQLSGGQSLELAPETELRVDNGSSEVADGSVLVRTSSPFMVRAGGAEIEASEAIFRVDRGASVLLAMYSGEASVLGSGVEPVPGLRQATVLQGGEIAGGLDPLVVRPNDPWDIQLLGPAIDLGSELLDLERGLTRQLPRGREIQAVSAVLEREFSPGDIRSAIDLLGNASSVVVAAVVAREAARIDGKVSLRRILDEVVDLQVLGANWIVIVAQWGLHRAAVVLTRELRELAAAIQRSVAPPPAPSASIGSTPRPQRGGSTRPDTDGGTGGGGNPSPKPAETQNNEVSEPPPPPPDEGGEQPAASPCANPVECAVDDIIDTP
jgi:hypothetical protein